jgi:hypothetical protein
MEIRTFSNWIIVFFLFLLILGCVQDPVKKAEDLSKNNKTMTIQTPTGNSFEIPAGRYNSDGAYRWKDRYNAGHIEMYHAANLNEVSSHWDSFEKGYCGSGTYSKKSHKEVINLKNLSDSAELTIVNFIINGHYRTVTKVYIPEIELLIIFSPYGQTGNHKEVVELLRQTLI